MKQQEQTLCFFNWFANDWNTEATDSDYSVIEHRHKTVFEAMKGFPANSSLLDVGCGTGQLAIQASLAGWNARGIDFSQNMIDLCKSNNERGAGEAEFLCTSVFGYEVVPG